MATTRQAFDIDAEEAILAHLFVEPSSLDAIADLVSPDEFFEDKNRIIFQTMLNQHYEGRSYDPISLHSLLKESGELDQAGGLEHLSHLVNPTSIASFGTDPLSSAATIRAHAQRRELALAGAEFQEIAALGSGYTADQAMQQAVMRVTDMMNSRGVASDLFNASELFDNVIKKIEDSGERPEGTTLGLPTGIPQLDKWTTGFKPGQLIFIAARPGVGKSTLAVDFGRVISFLAGKTTLFFSLEMSKEELMDRMVSAEADVELQKMRVGDLQPEEWIAIKDAGRKIQNGTFLISESPNIGLPKIRNLAMRQKASPLGLDMIVVDYLQLMEVPKGTSRTASRQEQVSELSRGLKLLAKELGVPIIVLAQLNRGPENRVDGVPKVSDLRESGSLEQDADIIMLLHRPEVNDNDTRPGECDLIVGKNRGGPAGGKIVLTSMLSFCKFVPGEAKYSEYEDEPGTPYPNEDKVAEDEEELLSVPW